MIRVSGCLILFLSFSLAGETAGAAQSRRCLSPALRALFTSSGHKPTPQGLPKRRPDRTKWDLVKNNDFNVSRTYAEYNGVFSGRLASTIRQMRGQGKRWIDMGAGNALAQRAVLRLYGKEAPEMLAVGYKIPGGKRGKQNVREFEAKSQGKFQYLEGKQTPASIRRLGKTDLITDVYAIAAYSDAPSAIIEAYLDILNPGGTLLVHAAHLPSEMIGVLTSRKGIVYTELEGASFMIRKKK